MQIYVIRHGQTTGDVEDRYGGDYDDHLTDLGAMQAKQLAEKIKDFGIEAIFVSSLIRAQETAKIINEKLGVEIKTVPGLRERNQNGILTGMKREEAKARYPDLAEKVKDPLNTIEGAEDFESFRRRVVGAFNAVGSADLKKVAIVTHGGPIRRILAEILQEEKNWKVADCAWFEVDYSKGASTLGAFEGISSE